MRTISCLPGGIERWLYRVARKHAGSQQIGWQFTIHQLYEKSGSCARFSDFALDVRKIVEAGSLPEYALTLTKNTEGEETVSMVRRSKLGVMDPRFEMPCHPRRRIAGGSPLHQPLAYQICPETDPACLPTRPKLRLFNNH